MASVILDLSELETMHMNMNLGDYRAKVRGCWMGKNIGGTLGAPMEFLRQTNDLFLSTGNDWGTTAKRRS